MKQQNMRALKLAKGLVSCSLKNCIIVPLRPSGGRGGGRKGGRITGQRKRYEFVTCGCM